MEDWQINTVESIEDANEFWRWLGERRVWTGFDTETGGLEFWKQPLRLVQFGDARQAWVMRWDRWAGLVLDALRRLFAGKRRVVGHNIGFDIRFIEKAAGESVFDWGFCHDTMLMAHILSPDKSKALKTVSGRYLTPQAKKLQNALAFAMDKQKWGWGDIPYDFPIYWGYAGVDTILTAKLAEDFYPQIDSEFRNVYDTEMQVLRICSDMEFRGTRIDVDYVQRMFDTTTTYCSRIEEYCLSEWGVRPSEHQSVAKALKDLGAPLGRLTATGQTSMDADALEPLIEDYPLARAVVEHRKKSKVLGTYFRNFLENHDDGRLHPSINTVGTRTGRMSVSGFAAQTLPRGSVVRNAIIPESNCGLFSCDYDAMEMRALAHFSQDPGMIAAIIEGDRTGSDIHTEMARIAFNDPSISKKDERRQTMKNGNFAKAYVAGVSKFAATIGVSEEEARAFFDMYDARFPGVKTFHRKVENTARQRLASENRPYVKTPLGRLQIADKKDKLYTLINYLIQGTCADVLKTTLIDLDSAGYGEYLLLPVHDECLFSIPDDLQHSGAKEEITKIMTQTNWTVPLTASCEGPFERWGAKYG